MNRLAITGFVFVGLLVVAALFAQLIATHEVGATDLLNRSKPRSAEHWLGTDATGRDVFSRLVYGARISLRVGLIVVAVSAGGRPGIGAPPGHHRGWVDRVVAGY